MNRLNLSSLRADPPDRPPRQTGAGLTRRDVLKVAGLTALASGGLTGLMQKAASAATGAPELRGDRERLALVINGLERWRVNTRLFGGAPRVETTGADGALSFALTGATYPGTSFPADLTAEVQPQGGAWQITIRLPAIGFESTLPLGAWLAGEAPALGQVQLAHLAAALPEAGTLTLAGTADVAFTPDFHLSLSGPGVARLAADGLEAAADRASIGLLPASAPSMMQHPPLRRTQILLERRSQEWPVWAALTRETAGRLISSGNPFELIRVEALETQRGAARIALVAEAARGAAAEGIAYEPGEAARSLRSEPYQIPLRQAKFAIAFDPAGHQTAVTARFGTAASWLALGGLGLRLGDGPNAPAFELVQRNGQVERRVCTPAILSLVAPMKDALVEPLEAADALLYTLDRPVAADGDPQFPITPPLQPLPPIDPVEPGPPVFSGVPVVPIEPVVPIGPIVPIDDLPIVLPPLVPIAPMAVIRPTDMLVLHFRFINLRLNSSGGGTPSLVPNNPAQDAFIAVRFPPQAIAEQAFRLPGESPLAPPIQSRAARESWLVFKVPASITSIEYSLQSLLDWQRFEPVVRNGLANPSQNATAATPFTAIEAPYRLFLSPAAQAGWAHSLVPVTKDGRTELWHTRLATKGNGGALLEPGPTPPTVRVVWSPDNDPGITTNRDHPSNKWPFTTAVALTRRDRYEILTLNTQAGAAPVTAERLMLTSQGAWLKLRGAWDRAGFDLTGWRHIATHGRDHYVKVVLKGYLYPFGHRAALIRETERRVEPVPGNPSRRAAYLRQQEYIVILEPERRFPGPEGYGAANQKERARRLPLRRVVVTTERTPALDPHDDIGGMGTAAFWPIVKGQPFRFRMTAEDWEGQRLEFSVPAVFVLSTTAGDTGKMSTVAADYAANPDRRTAPLHGQRLAVAKRVPIPNLKPGVKPGDVNFEANSLTFGAAAAGAGDAATPPFFPIMDEASVRIPALEGMSTTGGFKRIRLHALWAQFGFDSGSNPGLVFAELPDRPGVAFAGDKVGGVVTPDMSLGGLSLLYGLVGGDPGILGGGGFDPSQFLQGAKILGGIALDSLLQTLNSLTAGGDDRVPKISSKVNYVNDNPHEGPESVETTLSWKTGLSSAGPFVAYYSDDPEAASGTDSTLELEAQAVVPFGGGEDPALSVKGELKNFEIDLFQAIKVGFKELTFTGGTGQEAKVDVDLRWVAFGGPLAFVEQLRQFIGNLTKDLFTIDLQPSGVRAALSLPIPSVAVGVFALQNMKAGAALDLPFRGDQPMLLAFTFCSRESPFTLSVGPFGGGGFFGVTLGLSGMQKLEASLEFGGSWALNFGVASGKVYLMAGIYFKYEPAEGALLEGYLKAGGEVEILGIITISLELYLSLTYQSQGNKVYGQARVTVEVEICFFSISASFTVERQFSGSPGDPPFSAMVEEPDWKEYTDAFAA